VDNAGENLAASPLDARFELARLQEMFADSIEAVDPATPVPWCGSWTAGDLVDHLTAIHHWATTMARDTDDRPAPAAADRLSGYRRAATELGRTLADLDPQAPARTLVPDGTVAFWHRRQLHETLVHLWDLRTAGGLELVVAPARWADTVDEAATVMHPRQVRLGRAPAAPVRIRLTAVDAGRAWTLPAASDAPEEPAVAVAGPAEALALLLWRRTMPDDPRLVAAGDTDALRAVLADRFVP
jgi:uncharacterized protein (TIGR03083 family)